MGRPIYPYELADPDFSWLISNFRESNPNYSCIETIGLPVVFLSIEKQRVDEESFEPMVPTDVETQSAKAGSHKKSV